MLGELKIGIGQVNTMDMESINEIRSELVLYLEEVCSDKSYNLLLLMVTDIQNEGSEVFYSGVDKGLLSKAFGVQLKNGSIYLKGIVSRKKQMIPLLSTASY